MTNRKRRRSSKSESIDDSPNTSIDEQKSCEEANNGSSQNVRVVARVRPLSTKEINEHSKESTKALESTHLISVGNDRTFEYDAVFGTESTQANVYEKTAGDLIRNNVFKGFNVTILAYGQTGSGKTHTMGTEGWTIESENNTEDKENNDLPPPREEHGVIPRAVYDVFLNRKNTPRGEERVKVQMSYLEIYNEEARDLLSSNDSNLLQIRDSKTDGVVVQNLSCHEVKSSHEVSNLMRSAAQKRATGATAMNAVSSRSHAICTLYVSIAPLDDVDDDDIESTEEITAKLTLVDLAGSERIKRTGAEGARLKEGININKGLFVLGQVVSTLSELSQQNGNSSSNHIPYRDSKLTRLLQDSLGGNSKTVMVACVSPADSNLDESINTLRYAQRTRNIKNSAVRNVVVTSVSAAEVAALRRENQMLKLQLLQARTENRAMPTTNCVQIINSNISTAPSLIEENIDKKIGVEEIKNMHVSNKLKLLCSSLNAKIESLESQNESLRQDYLECSLKADRWQLKYQQVAKDEEKNPSDNEGLDLTAQLRNEIMSLKQQRQEAETDAAVSRATAAAVLRKDGDLLAAEEIVLSEGFSDDKDINEVDENLDSDTEKITQDLIAMSGRIDQKEEMMKQIEKENATLASLRSHFESAISFLQEEVDVLSAEREELLSKLENNTKNSVSNVLSDDKTKKKLRDRVSDLEKKMKDLKAKAAEHARSLRLRSQAEKKLEVLKNEISRDKKIRASLQRKLKEEGEERRAEKKAAKLHATKLLRDSQKMKIELQKVKDAAVKQANVLRRKAAEALSKHKAATEQQKRRNNASIMRNSSSYFKSDISKERKDEILEWLERETESALMLSEVRKNIEEHTNLLDDAESKKVQFTSDRDNVQDVSYKAATRAINAEIEQRTAIIQNLEKSMQEIMKANIGKGKVPTNSSNSGAFMDIAFWQSISRTELRFLIHELFGKNISSKEHYNNLRSNQNQLVSNTIADQKRHYNEVIMTMKIEHSEEITSLLQSTNHAMEHELRKEFHKNGDCPLDESTKLSIDEMLNSYFGTCNDTNENVKKNLQSIKNEHNEIKKMVDNAAMNFISQNEAAAILRKNKKKKKRVSILEDEEFLSEDDPADIPMGDSDDSDWCPNPHVKRKTEKKRKLDDSVIVDVQGSEAQLIGEKISEEMGKNFAKLKVTHLKDLCRSRGLLVGGRKADLIARLQADTGSKSSIGDSQSITSDSLNGSTSDDEKRSKILNSTACAESRNEAPQEEENDSNYNRRKKLRIAFASTESNPSLSHEMKNSSQRRKSQRLSAKHDKIQEDPSGPQDSVIKKKEKIHFSRRSNLITPKINRSTFLPHSTIGKENGFTIGRVSPTLRPRKLMSESTENFAPKRRFRKSSIRTPLKPLQRVTNSAKKRTHRQMEASVNKALLQLDALTEMTSKHA